VTPGHQNIFIRQALGQGIRLDGRNTNEYRDIEVTLKRSEMSSTATVVIGDTRVVSVVSGEIVAPYPDRPTEGIIQFNAEVSPMAEAHGMSQVELSRLLDRSIRESDAIDTESLCVIGGGQVWLISCDVRVLDCGGGNVVDASLFAAMSALRAFRKPEVTVVSSGGDSFISCGSVTLHSSDEREPLPLALHHTPLSVTLGVFKGIKSSGDSTELPSMILIADPSSAEESCMDGSLTFSINAHRELCAIHKPGQVAVTASVVLKAAKIATNRANALHEILDHELKVLEDTVIEERTERLQKIRILNEKSFNNREIFFNDDNIGVNMGGVNIGGGGIDRDDPMLAWASLHQAVGTD